MGQLFDKNGHLLRYNDFNLKYNLAVTPKEYTIVFDAITKEICELFKCNVFDENMSLLSVTDTTIGKACFDNPRKNNKRIRALFQQDVISVPSAVSYWQSFVPDDLWEKKLVFIPKIFDKQQIERCCF